MAKGKSAREFALDLKKFGELSEARATLVCRKIILDLDSAVVLDTPVLTGRARGNWYPSINVPSKELDENTFDSSGGKAIGRVNSLLASFKLGDVFWMTNNLPYILPLENGHSKKSPEGMVDRNLARFAQHYGGSISR